MLVCLLQDRELLRRFALNDAPPAKVSPTRPQELVAMLQRGEGMPEFKNGRVLRDYQETSFKWMVQHNLKGENCILGDEMGLGAPRWLLRLLCNFCNAQSSTGCCKTAKSQASTHSGLRSSLYALQRRQHFRKYARVSWPAQQHRTMVS